MNTAVTPAPHRHASRFAHLLRKHARRLALTLLSPLVLTTGLAEAQSVQHLSGSTAVHATSAAQHVLVTVQTTGTVSAVRVLTAGTENLDFADAHAGLGACAPIFYLQGSLCVVDVTFTPSAPGRRKGSVVLLGSQGQVLGMQLIDGVGTGPLAVIRPGRIDTVAGSEEWIFRNDGIPANTAQVYLPAGMVTNGAGDLFLSDTGNSRIRRADATTGVISTVAGPANISSPSGLAIDGAGNLYFADAANDTVRRIDAASGALTTIVGTTQVEGNTGDGGLATSATLHSPNGIAFDADGNLYIADSGNNSIRRVDASTRRISTVAGGNGQGYAGDGGAATAAKLYSPWGVTVAPDGSLYFTDRTNNVVRHVDAAGNIHTVIGTGTRGFSGDGAAATAALLNAPSDLAFDPAGNLYVADAANNRVRRVDAASGLIATISGTTSTAFAGDGFNSDLASLSGPNGVHLDSNANLYIADLFHNRVRRIQSNYATMHYPTIKVSKVSDPQMETLENDGTAVLNPGAVQFAQAALDPATTTCNSSPLQPNTSCTLGVQFAPTHVSANDQQMISGAVTLPSDAANAPDVIVPFGLVLTVEPTHTTLTSSANPAIPGQAVVFTASVSSADTGRSGTVTFMEGTRTLGSTVLNASGSAALSINDLAVGQHTIIAKYAGDANNAASDSDPLVETILQTSQVSVASSQNPSTATQMLTFTATVTAAAAVSAGSVDFYDGSTRMGSGTVSSSGVATFSTQLLQAGTHTIVASFGGNTTTAPSQGSLTQTINRISTTTLLSVAPTTITVGANVTMQVSVSGMTGVVPTGAITFREDARVLGLQNVDSNGNVTYTTSALTPGTHSVTASYGGDSWNNFSTSTAISVTVNKLTTNTVVTTSANPSDAGSTLTVTATVTPASGQPPSGAITGYVMLYDGATSLGNVQLGAGGAASISSSAFSVGTHTLTATYQESSFANSSTSAPFAQVIQQAASRTSLALSAPNTIAGKPLTLTATVATTGATRATGTITFLDGGTSIGQATLNVQGIGSFTTTTLPVGSHSLTAAFAGDVNFTASQSAVAPETVRVGSTTLTLAVSSTQLIAGSTLNVTSKLTSDGVLTSTTAVTLLDNGTTLATLVPNSSGAVSFSTSTLAVGSHTLQAVYAGDANNAAASSPTQTVEVQQAKTTTALMTSGSPAALGSTVTLHAAVTTGLANPTGNITFADGGTTLAVVPVSTAGDASLSTSSLTIGAHNITATYSGDPTHSGSVSAAVTQQIVQGSSVAVQSSSNPSVAGLPVDFSIQVTAAATANSTALPSPTGNVTVLDGSTPLGKLTLTNGAAMLHATALAVGTHGITVVYAGDVNFQGSTSAVLTQVVKSADTHATLTASANQVTLGTNVTFAAAVTGNGSTFTGTVTFLDGNTAIGKPPISAAGTASFATATLSPGMHTLTASYSGDANNGATISAPVTVQVQQNTDVAVTSSSNPALTLDSFTLIAVVHNSMAPMATGTVRFSEGADVLGTATLDPNGSASLRVGPFASGTHTFTASYSGDVADYPVNSAPFAVVVNLRPTTSAVTATAPSQATGGLLSLISVLQYTGPVVPTGTTTFRSGSNVLGTSKLDAAGVATFTIANSVLPANITTTYSGDAVYAPSSSTATAITGDGAATNFTLTLNPGTVSMPTTKFATVQISLHSMNGFSDTLSLGCLGLPFAATCTFEKDQVKLEADGTVTVKVTVDTGSPLTGGGQARLEPQPRGSNAALCCLPVGALCALFLLRSRRRAQVAGLLLMMVLAVVVLPLTGCGSIDQSSTPPGGYTFKISAAGQNSGVTLSQPITMTVTK